MFQINSQPATGLQAEAHYVEWCLSLQNEHNPVPHNALDAMADWQRGAYRNDADAYSRMQQSGITKE
jgi:hypothetical protein